MKEVVSRLLDEEKSDAGEGVTAWEVAGSSANAKVNTIFSNADSDLVSKE